VPFFPSQGFFVGATSLELQQQLSQFLHVLFAQPSSRTFWLMALSVKSWPVNPVRIYHLMIITIIDLAYILPLFQFLDT
jgi:hypothetical protein